MKSQIFKSVLFIRTFFVMLFVALISGNGLSFSDFVSVGSITSGIVTNRTDIDYYKEILKSREKNNFLTWLMREIDSDTTETPLTGLFELKDISRYSTVNKAVDAVTEPGGTLEIELSSIKEANSVPIRANLLIKGVPVTSENTNSLLVVGRSGNKITVVANNKAKHIPTFAKGTILFRHSNTHNQNSLGEDPVLNSYDKETQPTQIFRTTFGSSDTVANQRLYGESERSARRLQKEIEHIEDIEYAYLLNTEMSIDESDETSQIHRGTFKGLIQRIKDLNSTFGNLISSSGGLEVDQLRAGLSKIFSRKTVDGNQKRRICLHNTAMGEFAWGLNQDKLVTYSTDIVFGQNVDVMKFAGGELVMVEHPLLSEYYNDPELPAALIIHPRFIKERFMKGRSTHLRSNIQEQRRDGYLDEFLTESVILMGMMEMQGFIDPEYTG
jgi:hypothetical protein